METVEKTGVYSKKVQALRNKKIVVTPVHRSGGWLPENHDSSFLNDGSAIGIVVPNRGSGHTLVDPLAEIGFTDEDRELFARELGLESSVELSVFRKKNFWTNNNVSLNRNGLYLNLNDLNDFIKYLILRSDNNRIAPSWSERFDLGTRKFALVEDGEALEDNVSNLEDKKNAYLHMAKLEKSIDKMTDFLYVYYIEKRDAKKPPRTASVKWLKNEIGRIIEDDIKVYLKIIDDKDYEDKLLIQKAVANGALLRDRHEYRLPGADRPIGVLEDVLVLLSDPKNQELKMKLMNQIEINDKK